MDRVWVLEIARPVVVRGKQDGKMVRNMPRLDHRSLDRQIRKMEGMTRKGRLGLVRWAKGLVHEDEIDRVWSKELCRDMYFIGVREPRSLLDRIIPIFKVIDSVPQNIKPGVHSCGEKVLARPWQIPFCVLRLDLKTCF